MANLTKSTAADDRFDRIESYYLKKTPLSDKDKEIAQRLELVFALFLRSRSRHLAISKLIKIEEEKGNSLSKAQAYRDFRDAERLFAPIQQYTKEFIRLTSIESALRDIRSAEKKAAAAKTVSEWKICMEIKNKAEYRIIQASGVTHADVNLPDFSKIQPADISINVSDEIKNLLIKVTSSGLIDASDFYKKHAIEVKDESTKD